MNEVSADSAHLKIGRSLSLLTLSTAITMGLGLILRVVLPRLLGPEKMGVFYFAESFCTVFFAFLPLGMSVYIQRTVPSDPLHARDVFGSIVLLELVAGFLIFGIMIAALFQLEKPHETLLCVAAMSLFIALQVFRGSILQGLFLSLERVKFVAGVNVVVKLIVVLSSLTMLLTTQNILGVILMFGLAEAAGTSIFFYSAKRAGLFEQRPSLDKIKTILRASLPFYLSGTLISIYGEVDNIMLAQFANTTEVGFYGAAFKLIGVALIFNPILINACSPVLSQAFYQNKEVFLKLMRQLLQFILVASLPLISGLALFGPLIVTTLYGPNFDQSIKILGYLTPVLVMLYVNTLTGAGLSIGGSGFKISRVFLLGLLINVLLDYFLIPQGLKQGLGGAGLAVCLCAFLSELYTFCAMLRIFPGKLLNFRLGKSLVFTLLPALFGIIFYDQIHAFNLLEKLGIFLLLPFYALLTGILTKKELLFGKELLQKKINKRMRSRRA